MEVHQGGVFMPSDCLSIGDFSPDSEVYSVIQRQEVSSFFPLALSPMSASVLLWNRCFFIKIYILISDLPVNFKTSSAVYRNCTVTEP